MTLYRTGRRSGIEEVECTRANEKSVWFRKSSVGERRESRDSSWGLYHDTRAEAVAHVRDRMERNVATLESSLARAKSDLAAFNAKEVL